MTKWSSSPPAISHNRLRSRDPKGNPKKVRRRRRGGAGPVAKSLPMARSGGFQGDRKHSHPERHHYRQLRACRRSPNRNYVSERLADNRTTGYGSLEPPETSSYRKQGGLDEIHLFGLSRAR